MGNPTILPPDNIIIAPDNFVGQTFLTSPIFHKLTLLYFGTYMRPAIKSMNLLTQFTNGNSLLQLDFKLC